MQTERIWIKNKGRNGIQKLSVHLEGKNIKSMSLSANIDFVRVKTYATGMCKEMTIL